MKKLALTFAIILGISLGAYAQNGGLFGYGGDEKEESYNIAWYSFYQDQEINHSLFGLLRSEYNRIYTIDDLNFPNDHGLIANQEAPLGSGILLLIGMGAAYAAAKRRKE